MKRLVICTIVLSSLILPASACGPYYPYGEDVRFSILDPAVFGYKDFCGFNYSARIFYAEDCAGTNEEPGRILNVLLWQAYCKNRVDTASIYKAVYELAENEIDGNKGNAMTGYLLMLKDTAAINYLKFAKRCNDLNTWLEDPWERNKEGETKIRIPMINWAINAAKTTRNKAIQKRYAFLAIRLSFYNGDEKGVGNIYNRYFKTGKEKKDIIDYWALYFQALMDDNPARQNYSLALVFSNAPDKRLAITRHYNRKVPLATILALAKSSSEKAAICLINDLQNVGTGLAELQTIYQLQPNSRAFGFLLLREINKLEDWIYTPYYTFFQPSISSIKSRYDYDDPEIKDHSKFALAHIDEDRRYAQKLLQFIETVNSAKVENAQLIGTVKAYLQIMTKQYEPCLSTIRTIPQPGYPALLIKALCLVSMQPLDSCKIPEQVKSLIVQQGKSKNNKFLFAIARELEYKGNTTEAALLYSKLDYSDSWENNNMYWRTKRNYHTLGLDFYEDYFFYIDAQYNSNQMETLIASIKKSSDRKKSKFEDWAFSDVEADIDRLYDLLGTKYIRLNKLDNAYKAFAAVNDSVWNSASFYYRDYLDANPFYTNFYTEHQKTRADTVKLTKTKIVARLLDYLKKAEDINNPRRDYYYFLAANCYFNMTQYGNSWMMRRYFWTINADKTGLVDDNEYFQANLAKAYYLKAKATTKMPQFAALCLRMAGRCENYRQMDLDMPVEPADNKYYKEIKIKYPGDFKNLISNCYSFDKYFAARQNMPW